MEITKVVKPFIRRGWPNTFGNIVYIHFQYTVCVCIYKYIKYIQYTQIYYVNKNVYFGCNYSFDSTKKKKNLTRSTILLIQEKCDPHFVKKKGKQ